MMLAFSQEQLIQPGQTGRECVSKSQSTWLQVRVENFTDVQNALPKHGATGDTIEKQGRGKKAVHLGVAWDPPWQQWLGKGGSALGAVLSQPP